MLRKSIFSRASKLLCVFACLSACLLPSACAEGETPSAAAPTSLDLRGTGLTDVSDLLKQTQLTSLDLRDNEISAEIYEALRTALPDCSILWSVPLGGERFDSDTTALSLTTAAGTADALAYFPDLQSVSFADAPDDATADALTARYPGVSFLWNVTIAGESYPRDTKSLDLSAAPVDLAALKDELARLPELESVTFGEDAFALSDQLALAQAYPRVSFDWNVQLLTDLTVRASVSELDLREYSVPDAATFSDALVLLPQLTRLDMCGSGPSDDEMAAMRVRYPQIKFIWYTRIYNWVVRTDIKGFSTGNRRKFPDGAGWYDADTFSYKRIRSTDFENLKYCTDLIALDVGHCSRIGDIDFLMHLPQLKYLDIALCNLTDISVLANLPELVYLQMMYNYIEDVSPLENCAKLRFVNASNNNLASADAFINMPALERLWINCSGLSNGQVATLTESLAAKLPDLTIKASQDNPEYAMSYWCKGNEGYVTVQALYGLRAKYQ